MSYPDPATTDWVPLWSAGPIAGYVPTAQIRRTTDQVIGTGSLVPVATDATPVYDTDAMSTTPGRLICKTPGYYLIHCRCRWASSAAGTARNLVVFKSPVGGGGDIRIVDDVKPQGGTADHNTSALVYLGVNDYVYAAVFQDTGGNLSIVGLSGLSATFTLTATYFGPNVALGAVMPVAYGTTLPATPADGQEAILVDSITNPSFYPGWRFRYNAGSSSPYKWEFVGGAPYFSRPALGSAESFNNTTNVDLTNTPSAVLPRAGEYMLEFGAAVVSNGGTWSAPYDTFMQLKTSGGGGVAIGPSPFTTASAAYGGGALASKYKHTASGSETITLYRRVGSAYTSRIWDPWLSILPVRVS
jgi:hypothetical protein